MKKSYPASRNRLRTAALWVCGALVWAGCAGFAAAQVTVPPAVTGTADPGRINRSEIPATRSWMTMEGAASSPRAVANVPEGAEDIRFVLRGVVVDGMTAYDPAAIVPLYADFLDREISVADLFSVMNALQQRYLDDGFTLSRVSIPNQSIEGGQVRLSVIEGYVAHVEIDPDIRQDALVIADVTRRILAMQPLNTVSLERLLLVLNDLPGLNVSAVLASIRPEDEMAVTPGGVKLLLQKNERAFSRYRIGINNHGSKFTGPYQFALSAAQSMPALNYSALNVSVLGTTSLQEQRYIALRQSIPVWGASGAQFAWGASWARTEPGSSLDVLDVKGRNHALSARMSYPLIKQRGRVLLIDAELEIKNSQTDILGTALFDDRQRIVSAGVNYSFSDVHNGVNLLDLHAYRGLAVMDASRRGDADLSRADGRPQFTKFNAAAGRLQALPGGWQVYGMLTGQYAFQPLLSSEEFGFGGEPLGRGYNPSEIAGDRGMALTLELRHSMPRHYRGLAVNLQPYVFYDVGVVWNIDNNDTIRQSAAAAGAGIRFDVDNQWSGGLSLGFPLTRGADNPPSYADRYGPRVLFSLSRAF